MSLLSAPEKPLKILTIDGGGLQAITSLLILDDLLKSIQSENAAPSKPRPCEVFDIIGGIGAGGWLALLLGRFCLDIPTCLLEWSKLMRVISPYSTLHGKKRRLFSHSLFDEAALKAQVERLTQLYATGKRLIEDDPVPRIRSKYVFVAALRDDKKHEYSLFRSYSVPKDAAGVLPGSSKPEEFSIVSAFGVTGAAKYFSSPWKEDIAGKGRRRFLDRSIPQPHNITELALNEVWSLFGTDVQMDVVVNIGPGLVSETDFKQISRSFSWGLTANAARPKPRASPAGAATAPLSTGTMSLPRTNTRGSLANMTPARRAGRTENEIEESIWRKLDHVYGADKAPPYYRLAPPISSAGAYRNDTNGVKTTVAATDFFLSTDSVRAAFGSLKPHWRGDFPRLST